MGHETALWVASLAVAAAMAGITVLAVVLWRTKHIAQQAGAAILFLESLAVSGFAVQFAARFLSREDGLPAQANLGLWVPALAGAVAAAILVTMRPIGVSGRPTPAGNR